ncbi:MAG: hypothetical protein M3280_08795 [Actinomycetota bacterium]|nr:hypothetical protein [Actinomycetota bacterium]
MHKAVAGLCLAIILGTMTPARAADRPRVVIFTLPAVTWAEVARVDPEELLELAERGSAGSVSVRAISSRTSYAAGFATLGGGSRIDARRTHAAPALDEGAEIERAGGEPRSLSVDVPVAGATEIAEDAAEDGYDAVPGALADALPESSLTVVGNSDTALRPPAPVGYGRWVLLAGMEASSAEVALAYTGPGLLESDPSAPFGVRTSDTKARSLLAEALEGPPVTIFDPGDLARADEYAMATATEAPEARRAALLAADDLLGFVADRLDFERDLLLVVSPTSPWWDEDAHLGVAIAVGPGFRPHTTLQSAFTRRPGVVALTDVAPTVLEHLEIERPSSMTGRPWFSVGSSEDPVSDGIAVDEESIFVENLKTPISAGFVIAQVLVYLAAIIFIVRRGAGPIRAGHGKWAEIAALGIVAFPISTFVAGVVDQYELGAAGSTALIVGIDAAMVGLTVLTLRSPLDRFLALTVGTVAILLTDLLVGSPLQLNTVLGYSPVVAGRFAGLGNIGFAILGIAALLTGALVVHKRPESRWALFGAAAVFAVAILFDGAPQLGSDVGGVIALVPALGLTWLLLAGGRPTLRIAVLALVGALVMVAIFLAVDLARPADEQTHLARFYEDVRDRGAGVLVGTLERKARANVRLFTSTFWTYFVPPALLTIALLLQRPRGRWQALARAFPKLRSGLIGGLLLAVVGFVVNDSGIVIPALVLTYLVPMSVILHLCLLRDQEPAEAPA